MSGEWRRLGESDRAAVEGCLARDPVASYVVAELLGTAPGGALDVREAFGVFVGDTLGALAVVDGDWKLFAPEAAAWPALVARVGDRPLNGLSGPQAPVDAVLAGLPAPGPFHRVEYHYLTLTPDGLKDPGPAATVRPARPSDLEAVARHEAEMLHGESGVDPAATNAVGHLMGVMNRILDQDYFVWVEDGEIQYQGALGAKQTALAEVVNLFTPPALRGRGYGKRGLAALCRLAFARYPRLVLRVRVENLVSLAVVEAVGFRREPGLFSEVKWGPGSLPPRQGGSFGK